MTTLEKQLLQKRNALLAQGIELRLCAQRIRQRLAHPLVLVAAFGVGMLWAKGAPMLRQRLPRLSQSVQQLTGELHRLQVFAAMAATLPMLARRFLANTNHKVKQ